MGLGMDRAEQSLVEITLPKLGESIQDATIVQWLKKEGEAVALDEPILEVATDKVNSEIPSPVEGVLTKILAQVDEKVDIGAPLARIQSGEGGAQAKATPTTTSENHSDCPAKQGEQDMRTFFSPTVLRLARLENVSMEELERIPGKGLGGRVSRKDLEAYLEQRGRGSGPVSPAHVPSVDEAPVVLKKGDERIPMSAMRMAISDSMSLAKKEIPHAQLIIEVDVTEIQKKIARDRDEFRGKHGAKMTVTAFVLEAVAKTLPQFPLLNATLIEGGKAILTKANINLGVAVSVEGGIFVPVIRQCQNKDFVQICKALGDISMKARSSSLSPDDTTEGTFTVTNFGMSGVLIGTPIIRHPEVSILGMGTVKKELTVLGDNSMAVRDIMRLTLSFDHRVIDGMYGCAFLAKLKECIEHSCD